MAIKPLQRQYFKIIRSKKFEVIIMVLRNPTVLDLLLHGLVFSLKTLNVNLTLQHFTLRTTTQFTYKFNYRRIKTLPVWPNWVFVEIFGIEFSYKGAQICGKFKGLLKYEPRAVMTRKLLLLIMTLESKLTIVSLYKIRHRSAFKWI